MAYKLLIVESPTKAKTINKYLGKEFVVIASFGHVRSIPPKSGSIDVNNNFNAKYVNIAKNKKHIDEIISKSKHASEIYLATDPDREGEAIAWHISYILIHDERITNKLIKRVTFNEITKNSVLNAIANPRDIDMNLVEAQEARVALDYLIGFNVSPLLWRKVKTGLSAGRVQSPSLRLICEREAEIKDFIAEDYFLIKLETEKNQQELIAKLTDYQEYTDKKFTLKKIETKTINKKDDAVEICNMLKKYPHAIVSNITTKEKKRNPLPPFITSSLQIEASRKLNFNADKTMKTAQNLYEGIDIGNETIGLITYMRTDSISLSDLAINDIREYISGNYNAEYLPKIPNKFTNKVKNAQEAHEAIRPTDIYKTPQSIKQYLTIEQYKLYELIWLRTLASQMSSAIMDATAIDLQVGIAENINEAYAIFRLTGMVIKFNGFLKIYKEELEDNNSKIDQNTSEDELALPKLLIEEKLTINDIVFTEHQTEPKPRFSEASLLKTLEELGIGRPSTYAGIFSTLKKREYVFMDKKRFIPTDIGVIVNQFLTNHLSKYVDYQFTAKLEDTLDEISNGQNQKLPILQNFWNELDSVIKEKQAIAKTDLIAEKLDELCPECNSQLLIRLGKYGKFIGCSAYPKCKYMKKLSTNNEGDSGEQSAEVQIIEDRLCPKDNGLLLLRTGKYGKFIACKNYPKCKYIESVHQASNLNIKCPNCDKGKIVVKKNRYGSWFYSCDAYPDCKTIFNHKPISETCPQCNYAILLHKISKRTGEMASCPKCDYQRSLNTEAVSDNLP